MADRKIFANQGPADPDVNQSFFDLSHTVNDSFRFGRVQPIFCYDAAPKSRLNISLNYALKMDPLVFPVQTDCTAHVKFYKIPKRILWKHYKRYHDQIGTDGMINGNRNYVLPYIKRNYDWCGVHSLAEKFDVCSSTLSSVPGSRSVWLSRIFSSRNIPGEPSHLNPSIDGSPSYFFGQIIGSMDEISDNGVVFLTLRTQSTVSNALFTGVSLYYSYLYPTNGSLSSFAQFHNADFSPVLDGLTVVGDTLTFVNGVTSENATLLAENTYTYLTDLTRSASDQGINYNEVTIAFKPSHHVDNRQLFLHLFWDASSASVFGSTASNSPHDASLVGADALVINDKDDMQTISVASTAYITNPKFLAATYDSEVYENQDNSSNHFMVQDGDDEPNLPICALPFRAYEFIHNFFFRNTRIVPFIKDGVPCYDEFITNDGDGADETTPLEFFNADYESDLFTTCVKEPMFGKAPLVGITTNDSESIGIFTMRNITATDADNVSSTYNIGFRMDENNDIVSITNYDEVADKPSVQRLSEAIKYGISINDFRNVNALHRFQERHMRAGTLYQDLCQEFWGVRPNLGEEFPEYIGGDTSRISVSEITNLAQSETAQLGEFAGQGSFRGQSHRISCFTTEECYIIGLMYISVTPTYMQQLPRHMTARDLLDFANPEFFAIGPQPVYKHQIAPMQLRKEHLFDVFGYNRPYSHYLTIQDKARGDFRTNRGNFILQRVFASEPELNQSFVEIDSSQLTNIFSVQLNDDKIYGQIRFNIDAKLPFPRFYQPRLI